MTLRGTNPASYITEYTLVYEDKLRFMATLRVASGVTGTRAAAVIWVV